MKELLRQDSRLRRAQYEELVEGQAEVAVLFHRPSRRCTGLSGKIKAAVRQQRVRFQEKKSPAL
jgi:predicted phosphohydrolase